MQLHWRKSAPQEIDYELVWLTVSLGAGCALAAWLTAHLPTPQCVFHSLTGFPCVTCGATRAAIQFFHGHFGASFLFNPLAFLAYCGLIVFDLYAVSVLITRTPRLRLDNLSRPEKNFARGAAVLLLASNWIYLLIGRLV